MDVQAQMFLQLVDALRPYKGRTDVDALYDEFHSSIDTLAEEISFNGLMGCVTSATVAKLLMWPSFPDFKNMILAQDKEGLTLYIQALMFAEIIPTVEGNAALLYISTRTPASFVQAPIVEAFDFFKLANRYGSAAIGMPNVIPKEDFILALEAVNEE